MGMVDRWWKVEIFVTTSSELYTHRFLTSLWHAKLVMWMDMYFFTFYLGITNSHEHYGEIWCFDKETIQVLSTTNLKCQSAAAWCDLINFKFVQHKIWTTRNYGPIKINVVSLRFESNIAWEFSNQCVFLRVGSRILRICTARCYLSRTIRLK